VRVGRTLRIVVALVASALAFPAGARAKCYAQDCDLDCGSSWSGFTALLESADYPEGGQIPLAFVDPADGIRHRFVAAHQGKIWVWDADTDTILQTPYLDLSALVNLANSERGLLALAVDPEFATTGELYVLYTRDSALDDERGDLVLARYTRQSDNAADPASAETILVIDHHQDDNHNGGWLAFGPDGMLYLSTGDGGGGCDDDFSIPPSVPRPPNGQNLDSLLAKLLRIDVRGVDAGGTAPECGKVQGEYTIPLGNPFAGAAVDGCGEIWAYGLRNPFRFSFDRLTGDLWLGDVGQSNWEEIDWIPAAYFPLVPAKAMNFGWRCREGCAPSSDAPSSCPLFADDPEECPAGYDSGVCSYPSLETTDVFHDPVLCHENHALSAWGDWQAIMGGRVYRGSQVRALSGRYLYGDAYCGQLWRTTSFDPANPVGAAAKCWDAGHAGLYGIAEDDQGELYLLMADGRVVCVDNGAGCPWAGDARVFRDGFESGDVARWSETNSP